MNKKQASIIITLVVLITCVGVLAIKVNGPLNGNSELGFGKSAISMNKDSKTSTGKADFFVETKLGRDNQNAQVLQNLKSIIDDTNVSRAKRDETTKKFTQITSQNSQAQEIESVLKTKGFEDAVCFVEENRVRVIIKTKDKLTEKQNKMIQDVVMSVAKTKNVEIETKE